MSKILKTVKAMKVMEGAGVPVNRVFGHNEVKDFDPFLMLDYFISEKKVESPGFPWHPHKGIETISYFLKGSGMHEDSLGNKGVISAGELQWMTAGRGILHQEMPTSSSGGIQGFQFWVNLPAEQKLIEPSYQYIKKGEMKSFISDGIEVKVISGSYKDIKGPIDKSNLGITMLHVIIEKGQSLFIERDSDKNGFVFLFSGVGLIDNEKIEKDTAYLLDAGMMEIKSTESKIELIFAQGIPLNEPIAWRGPIVMNTREELIKTFHDLNNDTFIK